MKTYKELKESLVEVTKGTSDESPFVHAFMMGNPQGKVKTGYGDKTLAGVHAMLNNKDVEGTADALLNGKDTRKTTFGTKSREGVIDMIKRHQAAHKVEESLDEATNPMQQYHHNEDENNHTANVELLAHHVGDSADKIISKHIAQAHKEIGRMPKHLMDYRNSIHDRLYPKFKEKFENKD